jgi:hypothetical protein
MLKVFTIQKAIPSLTKDLKTNGIKYEMISKASLLIEDTPKGRTAIRLVRERFGLQSISVK